MSIDVEVTQKDVIFNWKLHAKNQSYSSLHSVKVYDTVEDILVFFSLFMYNLIMPYQPMPQSHAMDVRLHIPQNELHWNNNTFTLWKTGKM